MPSTTCRHRRGRRWQSALGCLLAAVLGLLLMSPRAWAQQDQQDDTVIGSELIELDAANVDAVAALARLEKLETRQIMSVQVTTTGGRWSSSARVTTVKPGDRLSAALTRRGLRELLATGQFAQGYADARPLGPGVALRYIMTPRRLAASVRIYGGIIDAKRTLDAVQLGPGSELTEASFRVLDIELRRHYRRYGYDSSRFKLTTTDTDNPLRVVLRIDVTPGPQRKLTRRIFVIEPLNDALVGDIKHRYAVEPGAPLEEDALVAADAELAEKLRQAGFFEATVKHLVKRQGAAAFVYIYLETGPQYRFRFEGNRAFEEDELREELGLDSGDADTAADGLAERTRAFYQKRGFYDVQVRADSKARRAGSIRELTVRITEGRTVRVSERLFACLPRDAPEGLTADDLGDEIDAILSEELPGLPLIHAIDPAPIDQAFSPGGSRAPPRRLAPAATYTDAAYKRAVEHLKQLLNSKGYLNAVVGPVSRLRTRCDRSARGGVCRPLPDAPILPPRCASDAAELPLAEPALSPNLECRPDPRRGITCAPTMRLYIPVQLGPQMRLYDVVFEGNRALKPKELLELSAFELGAPFSNLELDAARSRLLNYYKNAGYAYASVQADIERSPDRTRARARFIINERKRVIIDGYEVRGNQRTDGDLILKRLALCQDLSSCSDEEKVFRRDLVRKSEEQIARLGVFSSIAIALEDPEVPQERKRVIITVVEQRSQYIEPRVGISSGEGFRGAFEYGHRNIGGRAVALTVGFEFGLLPAFLILDDEVRENYTTQFNGLAELLERRIGVSLRVPEIGLGPQVDLVFDGLHVRDNQRDYALERYAAIPRLTYRPARQWSFQLGLSAEYNDVTVLGAEDLDQLRAENPALAQLLQYPDGASFALAQRIDASWDRRDSALAATSGTLVTAAIEHVSAFRTESEDIAEQGRAQTSEFIGLSGRAAAYLRLTDFGMALAFSVGGGYNLQLREFSQTYPDRLFYLGGFGTMRGWQLNSLVPEDVADALLQDAELSAASVVRGGNVFLNPRLELRIPITDLISTGVFLDSGNIWAQEESIQDAGDLFQFRYGAGAGLRLNTPVGPVALDYGFNLVRRPWEDLGALHFAVGLF